MDEKTIKLLALHQQARMQQEQLEQQEQADRNRAYEAEQLANIQKKQAEILLAQSIDQENTNKKLIEIENNKLLEEAKRTKIAFEALLTEKEVFDKGYNFDFTSIDPTETTIINVPPGHINQDLNLSFDFDDLCKKMFLLPKLNKAFLSGVSKRWEEIKCAGPDLDYINKIAFEAGKEGKYNFSIEYIPESIKDSGIIFILSSNTALFDILINTDKITQIKTFSLSKEILPFSDDGYFKNLNLSYKNGLDLYINELNVSENTNEKISERLETESRRLEELKSALLNKENTLFKKMILYFIIGVCVFITIIVIINKIQSSDGNKNTNTIQPLVGTKNTNTQNYENNKNISIEDKLYNEWRLRQKQ